MNGASFRSYRMAARQGMSDASDEEGRIVRDERIIIEQGLVCDWHGCILICRKHALICPIDLRLATYTSVLNRSFE